MSLTSRGRGWIQNDTNSLPKPGRPLAPEDVNHIAIINLINAVTDENLMEKAEEIAKLVDDKVNEQNLKNVHEKLYKHALNNKEFGSKLLKVYNCSLFKHKYDSENRSLHAHLVRFFQVDYERRKELREENVTHFREAICLFSEFLSSIISSTGENFFRKLQLALLNYMEMLVETASVEDIKILAEQMTIHGKHFHNSCKDEMDNLMIVTRKKLIKYNLSPTSRKILLYIVDLENRNFGSLPIHLQKFYKSQLESDFKEEDNVVIKFLTQEKDVVEHNSSKNDSNDQKQQSVPVKNQTLRAIRGSGATDIENSVAGINKIAI